MKLPRSAAVALAFLTASTYAAAPAEDFPAKDTFAASVYRGSIAFQNYCVLCHGVTAEGNGRAAKMYTPPPYNLRRSMMPDAYKDQIIRKGGKAMGRSQYMPPWEGELTDEQIADVVNFLRTIAPPEAAPRAPAVPAAAPTQTPVTPVVAPTQVPAAPVIAPKSPPNS